GHTVTLVDRARARIPAPITDRARLPPKGKGGRHGLTTKRVDGDCRAARPGIGRLWRLRFFIGALGATASRASHAGSATFPDPGGVHGSGLGTLHVGRAG